MAVGFAAAGAVQSSLGLALLSGRAFVARLTLVVLGSTSAALAVAMALLPVLWPSLAQPVWLPALFAILPLSAVFGVLASDSMSRPRLVATAAAILVGWAGYGLGAYRAVPSVDPRLARLAADWAASGSQAVRPDLGITVDLPEGWVLLRDGHPLEEARDAAFVLIETQSGGVATLRAALRRRATGLDADLDDIARSQQASLASFAEDGRVDAQVGSAPARRLHASWVASGRSRRAAITVWRDGPRLLQLAVVVPRRSGSETDIERLHSGLGFRAVLEGEIISSANTFAADCPILDAATVRELATAVWPRIDQPSLFRAGYAAAVRGQLRLNSAEVEGMRSALAPLYAGLREEQRVALGEYVEQIRLATSGSPGDDARMATFVCESARRLDAARRVALTQSLARAARVSLE